MRQLREAIESGETELRWEKEEQKLKGRSLVETMKISMSLFYSVLHLDCTIFATYVRTYRVVHSEISLLRS